MAPGVEQRGAARAWFGFMFGVALLVTASMTIIGVVVATRGEAAPSSEPPVVARLSLSEFSISGDLQFPVNHDVVVDVVNDGSAIHNLVFETGQRTPDMAPGETYRVSLGKLPVGTLAAWCDIVGHREAGMEVDIEVTPEAVLPVATSASASGGHGAHGHGEDTDWAALQEQMLASMADFPVATEGSGNALLEPEILADGTKRFEVTAAITPWEVEPGKFVDAWTYNGIVPGPKIQVDVGDNVQIVVNNELPIGTDVHWHGIRTPNEMDGVSPITQDLIEPGESFTYEFLAERPSIGMYHAHFHGHEAIVNGLFAAFQIGPPPIPRGQTFGDMVIPDDLEIAQEVPMVLNDAGVIGFSLNGKSFPATEPYVFQKDDWFVVHYYNEGLMSHPMHMHQLPQLVFAKDGFALDQPYLADTINVAPGERYSVLVHADSVGTWVWHCHILTHVERNGEMFGMVTAVVVQDG